MSQQDRTAFFGAQFRLRTFLYKENYSLYEWFSKAYGDKEKTLLFQNSFRLGAGIMLEVLEE